MKRLALSLAALAVVVTGCRNGDPEPAADRSQVTSWCDEHGNRVYVRGDGINHALFVLGADPTCAGQGR